METKSREQFLRDYHFRQSDLLHSEISYRDLLKIKGDFQLKLKAYDEAGIGVLRSLLRFGVVHALKYRIKDPEHLMAKILRHKLKDPLAQISVSNYEDLMTDLIGIRILHLIKSHWFQVHEILLTHYRQLEAPTLAEGIYRWRM
jgi:putative GTP pyrophosphokinase